MPQRWISSSVLPRQGKMSPSCVTCKWLRLSLVLICTLSSVLRMVHASTGMTEPVSELCLSEIDIVAQMANATFQHRRFRLRADTQQTSTKIDWLALRDDYRLIRQLIQNTINGFEYFNQRIEQPAGFYLGNSAANLVWNTNTKRAEFNPSRLPDSVVADCSSYAQLHDARPTQQPILLLQSLRSHDQYNTTIYGMDDRYRGIKGKRNVLFINPQDAKKLNLVEAQLVDLQSVANDNVVRKVFGFSLVFYDIPQGNIAAYYPETNPLVSINSVGIDSYTPTSKSIPVVITASTKQVINVAQV